MGLEEHFYDGSRKKKGENMEATNSIRVTRHRKERNYPGYIVMQIDEGWCAAI